MSKTAQEWMETLNLPELPDAEFLDNLNAIEGLEYAEGDPDPAHWVSMTPTEIKEALLVESVGDAFKHLREGQNLSTREAADTLGISHGRVSQLEGSGNALNLATITRMAQGFGYRTRLTFEPISGGEGVSVLVDG